MDISVRNKITEKFWAKTAALVVLTPIASRLKLNPTTILGGSNLWLLAGLVILMTAMTRIARRQAGGWLWLAYFTYSFAFTHRGVMVWVYMVLSGLCVWTWMEWTRIDAQGAKPKETETEVA